MTRSTVCFDGAIYDYVGGSLGIISSGAAASGDLTGTYPGPTLAAIVAAAGPIGDTTHVPVVTIDAKGRVTALTSAAIAFPSVPVSSVFGRTGAVVAANGDYTAAQVGALASTQTVNGIATANATSADWSNSSHKITSLLAGAANTTDAANVNQVGGTGWTSIRRGSDVSYTSNTTLTVDSVLQFTATSGQPYEFEAVIVYASPAGGATPDLNVAFGEDTTVRGAHWNIGFNTSDSANLNGSVACVSNNGTTRGTAATDRACLMKGVYWGGGGTAAIYACQGTTSVNATIVRAASVLRYRAMT